MFNALFVLVAVATALVGVWTLVGIRVLIKGFGNESKLQSIGNLLHTMAGTVNDLRDAVAAEETIEQGLITLVNGLGGKIKNALPGLSAADQATLDGVIASVATDSGAMSTAITANTAS